MTETRHTRLLIIGSGPAGYTAGIYAARAMLDPVLIQGIQPGGQLTITTDVENWPGDSLVQGPELMTRMADHARTTGVTIVNEQIESVDLNARPFLSLSDNGTRYSSDSLILATGAQAKWLGLPSEQHFRGYGVSACATCDGFFFRDQDVVVVGGGNTAVEEALFLTRFASRVTLIHRRDELRAERILQERLFRNEKIVPLWFHELVEVRGRDHPRSVESILCRNARDGTETAIDCSGVFIAIGHSPASELIANQVEMRPGGYVKTRRGTTATSIDGVFAAGDLVDDVYRQAVTSAGMGCMAALDAEKYLAALE
ncbi:MAG: thioredoxin-disulfide reductase [Rhodobacteraceae bacterium]|nr:thioredoxin-disulfide reductase [Paracoccaceae bacterium]